MRTNPNNRIPARVVPDVSAAADPQNSSYAIYCAVGATPCQTNATTFTTIGGTGMASAVWLAAAAIAVQAANTPAPNTGIGTRIGLMAPALYTTYQNDLAGSVTGTQINGAGTQYCDYAKVLGTDFSATGDSWFGWCHCRFLRSPALMGAAMSTTSCTIRRILLQPPVGRRM